MTNIRPELEKQILALHDNGSDIHTIAGDLGLQKFHVYRCLRKNGRTWGKFKLQAR